MFDVKTGGSGYIDGEEPNTPIGVIVVKTRGLLSFVEKRDHTNS